MKLLSKRYKLQKQIFEKPIEFPAMDDFEIAEKRKVGEGWMVGLDLDELCHLYD